MSEIADAGGVVFDSIRAAGLAAVDARLTADATQGIEVDRLTDALLEHDWDFSKAFTACGAEAGKANALFARLIAESLAALGVDGAVANVRDSSSSDRPLADAVAVVGDRLCLFDARLASGRAAEHLARDLCRAAKLRGRAESNVVLLRPGVTLGEDDRELASLLGLQTIDQGDAFELFTRLASICGIERLPAALHKAEESLSRRRREGATCVFARESAATERARETSHSPAVIDLDNEWENAKTQGRDWIAWVYKDRLYFRARVDRTANPADLEKLLAERFKEFGKVKSIVKGKKSTSFDFQVEPLPVARDPLIENLEEYLRRPHDFV